MAVEIKELIIRAVAVEEPAQVGGATVAAEDHTAEANAQLVQACVREVLKVLERKSSR
ncbi:DUF5908 family protein [uncultured Microscilla sp.]|uniref:DUF5908 family protein n=1 Tax=uncultured Microscilla sp. TaxID=432653 RepID=UPI00261E8BD3|nr:DUF5908 family protein [uncultured Microscilla sp.]